MKKKNAEIRRVFSYAGHYKLSLFFSVFFAITFVAGQLLGILYLSDFFSDMLIGKNFEKVSIMSVLVLVGLGLMWASSHYLSFLSSNTLAVSTIHDLREDIFNRLMELPVSYYKKNQSGEILSRVLNDVSVIEIFLMTIVVELIAQPLTVIAVLGVMFYTNTTITLYLLAVTPVIALVLGGIGTIVQKLSHKVQKNISSITSQIQESVGGIDVIKGFGVEQEVRERFNRANDKHFKSLKKELRVRLLGTPSSEFLGVVGVIIILVLGAIAIHNHIAEPREITRFLLLATVLSQPLSKIGEISMILKKLTPAAQRIFEIIDSEEKEDDSLPDIGPLKGEIHFENVSFFYRPNEPILQNIELSIVQGETLAIVGASGAGKSTLVNLIPAFNRPSSGRVLLDGKDMNLYNVRSIRRQLSLVTQESLLFSGSIFDNIRLSRREASLEEVKDACRMAHIHDYIDSLPQGYDTPVGERGLSLSGGQRQRIVLARAILRRPAILILDEATSSLDAESEKKVSLAMESILGKQTTLIVAHKLSTIAHADKIVVIEGGRIVESGTHAELLQNGGIYHKLYQIQVEV